MLPHELLAFVAWTSFLVLFAAVGFLVSHRVRAGEQRTAAMAVDSSSCAHCGKPTKMQCSYCKSVKYCSQTCQRKDWKKHKPACDEMKRSQEQGADCAKLDAAAAAAPQASSEDEVAPVPKLVLHPYSSFLKHFSNSDATKGKPTGLMNHGNTCYANSILQCLLYSRPLASYLLSREHTKGCKTSGWCLVCELEKLALKAHPSGGPTSNVLSVKGIVQNLKRISKTMRLGSQEDAHEFFVQVLDTMESTLLQQAGYPQPPPKGAPRLDARSRETTLLHHCYGGYVRRQTLCTSCGHASRMFEHCLGLMIEMPGGVSSVEGALEAFFQDEWLDEENQYKCDKCKQHVRACRTAGLEVAPNVLTLCLKRFGGQRFGKITRHIRFSDHLDLSKYLVAGGMDREAAEYELFAVVEHLGGSGWSSSLGHYVAYIRLEDGRWYETDDDEVQKVSPSSVYDRQPYMLLYTRKAPKPAPDPSYKPAAAAVASKQAAASSKPRKLSQAEAQQAVMSRITTAPAALSSMAADTFSCSSASSSGELPAVNVSDASASSSTRTAGSAAAASSVSDGVEGHEGRACSSQQQQQQQQQQTDHMQVQQQEHSASNGDGTHVSSKGDTAGAAVDAADTGSGSSDEDDAGLASGLTDTQRARRNKKKKERLKRKKAREAAGGAAEDEGGTVAAEGNGSNSSSNLGKLPADSSTAVANGHGSAAGASSSGSPGSSDGLEALGSVAVGSRGSASRRSSGSGEELPVRHHSSEAQHKEGDPPGSPHSWSTARSCASTSASPASSSARSFASATSLPPFPAAAAPRLPEPNMRYRKYLLSGSEHPSGVSTWHLHLLTDLPGVTQASEEIGMHLAEGILALQVPGRFLLPGMTLPGVPKHALLVSCKWKCEKQQLSMRLEWPAEEGVCDRGRRSSGSGSSHAYSTDY